VVPFTSHSLGWVIGDLSHKSCVICHAPQTYNVTNLLEDIKGMYKIAGFKGHPVCFLFTDAEVKDEAFLEYINQLLMTGEVAGGVQCCSGAATHALAAAHRATWSVD
jgi:hypothetical protein